MNKILILANSSKGVYGFRNELVLEMLKNYEVVVSVPDDVCTKELAEEGCRVINTPINRRGMNPFEDLKIIKAYNKLIESEKPDVVLTYTIKPNVYGGMVCGRKGIPYIVTITGLGSTFQKEGIIKKIVVKMYRMGLKKAACVFFQNQQNMDIFSQNKISGKECKLVQGSGVNLEKFNLREYPKDEVTRYLFVGRIMKEKGIEEFLETAKQLHSEKVIFEILGHCDEDYQGMIDEYASQGIVTHYGFKKDVDSFVANASALVLPTYHEGMSNVLMEASAMGRPVIASNISGCKEIFEEGITGYGCEPQSKDSLKNAICKFLELDNNERKQMGINARKKMEREFDRQKVVQAYMEKIYEVVK